MGADKLQKAGLQKGDTVLLCMDRRMEYTACELGALRAGLTAVPAIPL